MTSRDRQEAIRQMDNWVFEGCLEAKFLVEARARVAVVETLMDAVYVGYSLEFFLPKDGTQPYDIEVKVVFQ